MYVIRLLDRSLREREREKLKFNGEPKIKRAILTTIISHVADVWQSCKRPYIVDRGDGIACQIAGGKICRMREKEKTGKR